MNKFLLYVVTLIYFFNFGYSKLICRHLFYRVIIRSKYDGEKTINCNLIRNNFIE